MQLTWSDRVFKVFSYAFVLFFALLCLIPLIMVFSVSFSTENLIVRNGYSLIPQGFTFDTYSYMFANSGTRILSSYQVTITVTVVGTFIALTVTSMISFALSIKQLRYRNIIAFLCKFTIIFGAGLVPWYVVCTQVLGFTNNIWGLIIPMCFSVWYMFLLRTYFGQIPVSLYESARVDGAGWFRIFWSIALPLSKTSLLTIGVMYALVFWNDWWHALMFVSTRDLWPLQFYLYNILSNIAAIASGRVPTGMVMQLPAETVKMAVTIVTIGPIIFLYPFVQKYFVAGVTTGAVKE